MSLPHQNGRTRVFAAAAIDIVTAINSAIVEDHDDDRQMVAANGFELHSAKAESAIYLNGHNRVTADDSRDDGIAHPDAHHAPRPAVQTLAGYGQLAAVRRHFGYRRLGWLLVREGYRMNHKKMYRLYHEEKLMVRRRGGRKRALGTRAPMLLPERLNQRWSLDFIADTLSDGRRFRILCVVDDFSRECLACVVDTSLSGVRVVRELERLTGERATPQVIVSDNGSELTSVAILRWVPGRVAWHYIEPGKRQSGRSAADHRSLEA